MKKTVRIVLVMIALTGYAADAKGPEGSARFSLNAASSFADYGSTSDGARLGTEYAGFRLEPDWRFTSGMGVRLGAGAGWAFSTNASGTRESPLHPTCNTVISISPYYEILMDRWFADIGAVLGCRARLPFLNAELSSYIMTVSVSAGLDARLGYQLSEKVGLFVQADAQRTFYDLLYQAYYPLAELPVSGCIQMSFGVRYDI